MTRLEYLRKAAQLIKMASEGDWAVKYELRPALDAISKARERIRREVEEAQSNGHSGYSARLY